MDVVLEMVVPEDSEVDSAESGAKTFETRRQKQLSKHARRRKEATSNAELCPTFHLEKLNSRLNTPDGGRTAYATFPRAVCWVAALCNLFSLHSFGMFSSSNPLLRR